MKNEKNFLKTKNKNQIKFFIIRKWKFYIKPKLKKVKYKFFYIKTKLKKLNINFLYKSKIKNRKWKNFRLLKRKIFLYKFWYHKWKRKNIKLISKKFKL